MIDTPEIEILKEGERLFRGHLDEDQLKAILRFSRYGPPPALAVDAVVLRGDEVLLIRRRNPPFQGMHALPGGFVRYGEKVEDAVLREVLEETGIEGRIVALTGVYSDPARDPRGHTVSVAFLVEHLSGEPSGGDDAVEAKFHPLDDLPEMAFDHAVILRDALRFRR